MLNNILKNKKGAEKILSLWWFFVLIIIAVGIIIAVFIYSSVDIPIKKLEADILANRVIDCLVKDAQINQDFLDKKLDIFEFCNLNKEIIDSSGKYYLRVDIYDFDGNKDVSLVKDKYKFGVFAIETQCKLEGKEDYPKCSEKNIYVLDNNDKQFILNVVAGSKQKVKKEVGV